MSEEFKAELNKRLKREGAHTFFNTNEPTDSTGSVEKKEDIKDSQDEEKELHPNPYTLRSLSEKALRKTEKGQALFGRDVELKEYDMEQIGILVKLTEKNLQALQARDPLWQQFETMEQEREQKLQSSGKISFSRPEDYILEDNSSESVTKKLLEKSGMQWPAIKVPSRIKHLFIWSLKLNELKGYLQETSNSLKGKSAKSLGELLRDLWKFNKELTPDIGKGY